MAYFNHNNNGYKYKIDTYCNSIDPFTLDLDVKLSRDPLPKNVGYFDIVNYCIDNGYTWQSFKAYKTMEAFQFFQNGLVHQTACQDFKHGYLILACVSFYHFISIIRNRYLLTKYL